MAELRRKDTSHRTRPEQGENVVSAAMCSCVYYDDPVVNRMMLQKWVAPFLVFAVVGGPVFDRNRNASGIGGECAKLTQECALNALRMRRLNASMRDCRVFSGLGKYF